MKNVRDGDIDQMPDAPMTSLSGHDGVKGKRKLSWDDMEAGLSIFDNGTAELCGDVEVRHNGLIIQYITTSDFDEEEEEEFFEYQITNTNARFIKIMGQRSTRVLIESEPDDGWEYWREFQPRDGGSRWDKCHPIDCYTCKLTKMFKEGKVRMTFDVPDKVKVMDRGELCVRLGVSWAEAENIQRGVKLPKKVREMDALQLSGALDITFDEAGKMLR